jgi:hypothetical protein
MDVERSARVGEAQDTSEEDCTGDLIAEGQHTREDAGERDTGGPYMRKHITED